MPEAEPGSQRLDRWRRHVLSQIGSLEPFDLSLLDAHGSVTVDELTAARPVPPHAVATTDGYAVRAADAVEGATLGLIGESRVDRPTHARLYAGQAVRVAAGAVLPEGADAVLLSRHVDERTQHLVVRTSQLERHDRVRPAGAELAEGVSLMGPGTQLGASEVGLLAAAGCPRVRVHPQPRAAVVSVGDELVEPAARLAPGQAPDVNGVVLTAMAREAGARAVRHPPVPDDAQALGDALDGALVQADLLVVSGLEPRPDSAVRTALARLGAVDQAHVDMEPGGLQAFGVVEGDTDRPVPVFGLPGQLESAAVSFEVLVRPGLRRLQGRRDLNRPRLLAWLDKPLRGRSDRVGFARVSLRQHEQRWTAAPAVLPDSGVVSPLAPADGLAEVPLGTGELAAGQQVLVHVLSDRA